MRYKQYSGRGWFNESYRHSLAARGIKTKRNFFTKEFEFQDSHQEEIVHSDWKGRFNYVFEAAGDIFRELSAHEDGWFAPSYVEEKIRLINYYLKYGRELWQEEYKDNKDKWEQLIKYWKEQPVRTKGQQLARDLNLAILSLPKDEAKSLVRVRSLIKQIRDLYE